MNRFDRVTSILIYLQTQSVVTAKALADRFGVSERTVYRDIRTLETAGVPVGSEAGVGYFLDKRYRLPPVMFTREEAAALLMGAKLIDGRVDASTQAGYTSAMDKIKAVLDGPDQDYLTAIDESILVRQTTSYDNTAPNDGWLPQCRTALARSHILSIDYSRQGIDVATSREVEPVGLYYYAEHWHLIAWCRLREDYRDFRLDRIQSLRLLQERFQKHDRSSLQEYLASRDDEKDLHEIELLFSPAAARQINEQNFNFGYVSRRDTKAGVEITLLTSHLDYLGRKLLPFTGGVRIVRGDALTQVIKELVADLQNLWR